MDLWDPTEKRVSFTPFLTIVGAQVVAVFQKKGQKPCIFLKAKPESICCIDVQHFDGLHQDSLRNVDFTVLIDGSCKSSETKGKTMRLNWIFSECFSDEQVEIQRKEEHQNVHP